jgi:N6-adenosine-specific RNA methylase IME4/ParB-like chromosome segregation protein Spo0J
VADRRRQAESREETNCSPASLRVHPDADRVPPMSGRTFAAFCDDIAERGLLVPLDVTSGGFVIDGRQRLRAALQLGLSVVPVRRVDPPDAVDYMLRAALARRDLTPSQRATLVVELDAWHRLAQDAERRRLANLRDAEVATLPPRGKSRDVAAVWAGVSPRTVQDALTVRRHDAAMFERVKAGELQVSAAARQVRRKLRDTNLPPAPALPSGPFDLIYADPPWQLGSPDSPYAPEQHYPTLPIDAIALMSPPTARDAVLFLWAVSSMLSEALQVMQGWGFECKTTIVWIKPAIGLGIWVRNQHELLLVGRKGSQPPPEPEDRCSSVLAARRGRHSEKPKQFYELIERMYPATRKLEMFARHKRPGWTSWGNEAEA